MFLPKKTVQADYFYPSGDNAECKFASTIAVGYENPGNNSNISWDSALVSGNDKNWLTSHKFTDVANPFYPDARRYPGIADKVSVPPNTKISIAFYAWNYTGHDVNVGSVHLFNSKHNNQYGLTNLGASGTYATSCFTINSSPYCRTGQRIISSAIGNYANRGNENGRIIYDFYSIQPIQLISFSGSPDYSMENLILHFNLKLKNISNYNLCNIRIYDKLPSGNVFDRTICINSHSLIDINYDDNLGKTFQTSFVNDPATIFDQNFLIESSADPMNSRTDNRVETKSAIAFRNDSNSPTDWFASQSSWGEEISSLYTVQIIPYSFKTNNISLNLDQKISIDKFVKDSDEAFQINIHSNNLEQIEYKILVTNLKAAISEIEIFDPINLTFLDIIDLGGAEINGNMLKWKTSLNQNQKKEFKVICKIKKLQEGSYEIKNNSYSNFGPTFSNETIISVTTKAILIVNKVVSDNNEFDVLENSIEVDDPNESNRTLNFKINVFNSGDTDAKDLEIQDNLSNIKDCISSILTISNNGFFENNSIKWKITNLPEKESIEVSFSILLIHTTNTYKSIDNNAEIIYREINIASNNTTTLLNSPSIEISKNDNKIKALPLESLNYEILVSNNGAGSAFDLSVIDFIPSFLENCSSNSMKFIIDENKFFTKIEKIAPNEKINFTISCNIRSIMPEGETEITNFVQIFSPTIEKKEAYDNTKVTAKPYFVVNKLVKNLSKRTEFLKSVDALNSDLIEFKIEIKNTGNANCQSCQIQDNLEKNIKQISGESLQVFSSNNLEINSSLSFERSEDDNFIYLTNPNFDLQVNEKIVFYYKIQMSHDIKIQISKDEDQNLLQNFVKVFSNENPENFTKDNASIEVKQPWIEISKRAIKETFESFEQIIFEIEIKNIGNEKAFGFLTDNFPNDITFHSSSIPVTNKKDVLVQWNDIELEPSKSIQIELLFLTSGEKTTKFVENISQFILYDSNQNEIGLFEAKCKVKIVYPILSIKKDVKNSETVTIGDEITFQIEVKNSGEGTAKNVLIEEINNNNLEFIKNGSFFIDFISPLQTIRYEILAKVIYSNSIDEQIENFVIAQAENIANIESNRTKIGIDCGKISGFVWIDQNKNKEIDFGEKFVANRDIIIEFFNKKYFSISDKSGKYSFNCLPLDKRIIVSVSNLQNDSFSTKEQYQVLLKSNEKNADLDDTINTLKVAENVNFGIYNFKEQTLAKTGSNFLKTIFVIIIYYSLNLFYKIFEFKHLFCFTFKD